MNWNFCTLTTVINGRELKYDIESGEIWCVHGKSKKWEVKSVYKDGDYLKLRIGNKMYLQHRVIYKFYNPNWNIDNCSTNNSIDHINHNTTDNCIANLRNLTHQQNQFNTKAKGYYWNKAAMKWVTRIHLNGGSIYLGHFDLEEDARNAYLEAKRVHHIITPL